MSLELLNRFKLPVFNFSTSEVEKICRSALILFAITAVMYALVGIFYDVVNIKLMGKSIVKPAQERTMLAASFPKQPADYYALIPQRNLFGSTDKAAADKKPEAAKPAGTLDLSTLLVVKGTVAGTGKDGFAVIEEKAKNKQ